MLKLKSESDDLKARCAEDCIRITEAAETVGDLAHMEPETEKGESITDVLDLCNARSLSFYRNLERQVRAGRLDSIQSSLATNTFNPLFIGPTGTAKTSLIKRWAQKHGYGCVSLNMQGDVVDFTGIKNIATDADIPDGKGGYVKGVRAQTVPTGQFDEFCKGDRKKILFIDEINTVPSMLLKTLYDVISFHVIKNGDSAMYLPDLLFVVGAMNPQSYDSDRTPLDPALKARMIIYNVDFDTKSFYEYLKEDKEYEKELLEGDLKAAKDSGEVKELETDYQMACGRVDIINYLIDNKVEVNWGDDDGSGEDKASAMVPRTFEEALNLSDGTRASFVKAVAKCCGNDAAADMSDALAGYRDKEHKANEIWGKDYTPVEAEEDEEDKIDTSSAKGLSGSALDKVKAAKARLQKK